MREFLSRFRFGDFAAYFLPGLVMLGAALWGSTLTVFDTSVRAILHEITIMEGLLLGCTAYTLGAFLSGSSNRLFPKIYRLSRRDSFRNARCGIYPTALTGAVKREFKDVFGEDCDVSTWSEDHFYIIRSVVNEKMPHASADATRQNDLMRLRENMVIPLVSLWSAALAFAFAKAQKDLSQGLTIGLISTAVAYIAAGRLVGRAADNRAREVREVCTAFVVGARLGMFRQTEQAVEVPAIVTSGEPKVFAGEVGKEILTVRASPPGSA